MSCTKYKNERKELFRTIGEVFEGVYKLNDNEKFIWMMASRNPMVTIALAKYIYLCRELRGKALN